MNVQGMAQAYQTQAASMPENNVKSQKKEDAAPERRLKQDIIVISDEARNRIKEELLSKKEIPSQAVYECPESLRNAIIEKANEMRTGAKNIEADDSPFVSAKSIADAQKESFDNVFKAYYKQLKDSGVTRAEMAESYNDKLTAEKEKPASKMTAEEKLRQADEFYAKHDELYAQQMASVMKTIGDGMEVAQEIFRRMSSGAKVSKEDEENLMQYDPQMYMAAKNAQMMAEQHEDMSDESLIRKFTEDHAGDRKDWTSELDNQIAQMQQNADAVSET